MKKCFVLALVFACAFAVAFEPNCFASPNGPKVWERLADEAKERRLSNIEHFELQRDKMLEAQATLLSEAPLDEQKLEDAVWYGLEAIYDSLLVYWYDWGTVPASIEELLADRYISRLPVNPYTGKTMKSADASGFSPGDVVLQRAPAGLWSIRCICPNYYHQIPSFVVSAYGSNIAQKFDDDQILADIKAAGWPVVPPGSIAVLPFL